MDKFGSNQPRNDGFNPDDMIQVKQLVDSLSPDEKNEIGAILRKCAGEMTLTRGGKFVTFSNSHTSRA